MHKSRKKKINDNYAVHESFFLSTDRTFLSYSNRCSFSDARGEYLDLVAPHSFASRSIQQ